MHDPVHVEHKPARGLLRLALVTVSCLVSVEVAGWVLLSSLAGGSTALEQRLTEAVDGFEASSGQASERSFDEDLVIHPYVGFMPRAISERDSRPGDAEFIQLNQAACFEPGSPLFSSTPDDLIVAICGGSVAKALCRRRGLRELEERLGSGRFAGRRLRFVVLAFAAAKQPQQLMALSYVLALGGRVDVLINLDGYNEVALHENENHPQGVSPSYPRAWFFRAQGAEVLPLLGELNHARRARKEAATAARSSALWPSRAYRLSAHLRDVEHERHVEQVEDRLRGFQPAQREDVVLSGPPSHAGTVSERIDELVEIWSRSSLQLARLCSANNIEYYHFLQPNQYVAGSKPLTDDERKQAYRPKGKYARLVPEGYGKLLAAGDLLVEDGVRFQSLTDVFSTTAETVYIDNCCHVNDLGNVLLAQAIAAFVHASR